MSTALPSDVRRETLASCPLDELDGCTRTGQTRSRALPGLRPDRAK